MRCLAVISKRKNILREKTSDFKKFDNINDLSVVEALDIIL